MYLVFDIGGTNMRVGVSQDFQSVMRYEVVPTPPGYAPGIQTLAKLGNRLLGNKTPDFCAGGIAATLSPDRSQIFTSANLPDWTGRFPSQDISKILGCSVRTQNDVALAALGEAKVGAGKDYKIVAYISIGTGVGGAKVVNGQLEITHLGFEPGHQLLVVPGEDGVGKPRELESLISGKSLGLNAKNVGQLSNDINMARRLNSYVAIGIYNSIVHWSPEIVILGGGVTRSGLIHLDEIRSNVAKISRSYPHLPQILLSSLGDASGLIGALQYIRQSLKLETKPRVASIL